jgi:hypothetical protein
MTKRRNNIVRINVEAIEENNRKNLIKSEAGQYIHWNQELRLLDMINNPKRNPNFSKERLAKENLIFGTNKS